MKSIKCPGCNANLEYNMEDEKLQCKYCGTIANVEEEKNVDTNILEDRAIEVNEGICPECGARLMTDINTLSAKCTYCDSSLIYNQRIKAFRPKKILLFEINIDKIKSDTLKKLYDLGVNEREELVEALKPIYLPYWIYYCKAEVLHNLTMKTITFENVLVDASKKIKDNVADLVERSFNLRKIRNFDESMVVGYFAEIYDVESGSVYDRAVSKMKADMDVKFPGATLVYINPKPTYILLPFYYAEKNGEQLLVNAQSGKICCNNISDQEYQILNTHISDVVEIIEPEIFEAKSSVIKSKFKSLPLLEKFAIIPFIIFFILFIIPFVFVVGGWDTRYGDVFMRIFVFFLPISFAFFCVGCIFAFISCIAVRLKRHK